ncbi:MAG: LysM peptidoglycan-binding domain-containing protein [Anaerolineae bacterium]
MEPNPQRRCPECGTPVAQKADTCLMCGASLKERKQRLSLPQGDLWWPLLVVLALVLLWTWKPWQSVEPQAMVPPTATVTRTATPSPTPTFLVVPTATPLRSPTPPPTATVPPNQTRHTVESGETVSSIAKLYGTTVKEILQANGLKENTIISPGQELLVPLPVANTATPTITPTPSPTPFEYTIKSGENLSTIAKRFGTTVEALLAANDIPDATNIRVGTKIVIAQPPDYSATMAYEIYEVQQGDTLYTIAAKFDLTIAEIREVNNLESDRLRVQQELRIPVGTATPTPTPTAAPTLSPTPGPAYPAPALLSPPEGASFTGADTTILLTWASVGILEEDEWYVVQITRLGNRLKQAPLIWTQATSCRVPADLHIGGLDPAPRFTWQVTVMQHTDTREDGTWAGQSLSPSSGMRTFSWQ